MFVRITTDRTPRPNSLNDLGLTSSSNPVVSLSEFTYKKGAEIYGEKEPAEFVYQVRSGAVRSYKLLSDGRRRIGAFHLVGDIFGLENGGTHRFTVEVVVKTTIRLIRRQSLEAVAETDAVVSRNLLSMTTGDLQHAENHVLLLGRKTALEKVVAFLLEMDERLTAAGVMSLPMTRRDIADYLGLTLETVSRGLSRLTRASSDSLAAINARSCFSTGSGLRASPCKISTKSINLSWCRAAENLHSGGRRRHTCLNACQSGLESRFFRMVERRLQHSAAFTLETFKHFVGRHLANQHEEGSGSGLNGGSRFLHPFVLDADIGQISAKSAGRRTEGSARQRHQKDQANKRSPERARNCPRGGGIDELVKFDVTLSVLHRDYRITKLNQVLFLHCQKFLANFFRLCFGGKRDHD
ncbi:cAMP-binding domain of CRP or a regulatory subunit of cAMP-dependent protein kinases [Bradyrhizobium sp. Rc2d]|nr:cAMP-binding domain of CRP or a regulatory subunit of cAMP-dependent protein kinases [Bradyrhizobium sp. Rc2d]